MIDRKEGEDGNLLPTLINKPLLPGMLTKIITLSPSALWGVLSMKLSPTQMIEETKQQYVENFRTAHTLSFQHKQCIYCHCLCMS